jgi:hypothetical protein
MRMTGQLKINIMRMFFIDIIVTKNLLGKDAKISATNSRLNRINGEGLFKPFNKIFKTNSS